MSTEAIGSERAVLSIIMKKPELFFTVSDILSEADFTITGNGLIYRVISNILSGGEEKKLDRYIVFAEAERMGITDFFSHTLNGELVEALEQTQHNTEHFNRFFSSLKQATIKRAMINSFDELKQQIYEHDGPSIELKNMVEESVLNCVNGLDRGSEETVCLSDIFEETIHNIADNPMVGLDIGLPKLQKDIGKIRNGSITGLFARAKAGKSQFAMWAAYQVAVKQRLPVLYLDTELQTTEQVMRLCGIMTQIPYTDIESGLWKSNLTKVKKIEDAFKQVKDAPIYHRSIAGQSIQYVVPAIRKFVQQHCGGPVVGNEPKCLIIYDYIKLMSSDDFDRMKEYQTLGLLVSNLHDCAVKLNVPVIALGQLNREAFKIDSELTVGGADRIVHNLDSFTILRNKRKEEIEEDGKMRGNSIFKVCVARHGPGHPDPDEWINLHFDKSSGQLVEDKRNSEVVEIVQRIEEEGTQKLTEALNAK